MGGKRIEDLIENIKGIAIHGNSLRISFQYEGKRVRETLNLEPTRANINYAVRLRHSLLHDITMGYFEYEKYFPNSKNVKRTGFSGDRKSVRVGELAEKYIKLKKTDIGIQTERSYENSITQCVEALGYDRFFSSLTGEDILIMRNDLLATRKARTVNSYLVIFRGFLEFAQDNGYTDKPLFKSAKPFKTASNDPDPLEMEEYLKLINNCSEVDGNLITVAVYTGLRTGELCALAWEDIDLDKRVLRVERTITAERKFKLPKTYEKRTVHLMPPAFEALKSQKLKTFMMQAETVSVHQVDKTQTKKASLRPVFRPGIVKKRRGTDYKTWFTTLTLYGKWRKLLKCTGIRYRTQYHTRHTYACWSLTSHGNVAFIANQMGHKDLTMLINIYGKWMESSSQDEAGFIWSEMCKKGHGEKRTQK